MDLIKYKDYSAKLVYDSDIEMFRGEVINTRDKIIFYGKSIDDLNKEMQISVDDYLKYCREKGVEPAKPYSGKFNMRIDPELHMQAAITAARSDISLNALIENALRDTLAHSNV